MKKQLRNAMLAGATLMLAASANAFTITNNVDGATLTLDWETATSLNNGNCRFATANGLTGEVLVTDKGDKKIYAFTKEGMTVKYDVAGHDVGTGISCDQAGNVICNMGFPGAASAKQFLLIKADGSEMNEASFDRLAGGRCDVIATRSLGDVFSEKGGLVFSAPNATNVTYGMLCQNGAAVEEGDIFYESPERPTTNTTTCFLQPMYNDFDEFVELSESVSCYGQFVYNLIQNNNAITYYDEEAGEFASFSKAAGTNSNFGFDWFVVNGDTYYVYGGGGAVWADALRVVDSEGNVVCQFEGDGVPGVGTVHFGSIAAFAREDGKTVDIYYYRVETAARHFVFEVGAAPAEPDPLYIAGQFQGWNPAAPSQFTYAEGIYSFLLPEGTGEFKISTTKGTWDEFNAGAMCVADDIRIADNTGATKYDLYIGDGAGNCYVEYLEGQWTIFVDLEAKNIWGVNATPKPAATDDLYITGGITNPQWKPENPEKFAYDAKKKLYTYELTSNGEFKVSTKKGSWDNFNSGIVYANITELDTWVNTSNSSANMKNVLGAATLIVDMVNGRMMISKEGAPAPECPETCAIIGELVAGSWTPSAAQALTKTGDYEFSGEVEMAGGHFSLCERAGQEWSEIGKRWNAPEDNYALAVDAPAPFETGNPDNCFDIVSFTDYPVTVKFVVNFEDMTITISKGTDGVSTINADNEGAVEYFNLQGVRVANPENGLYIVRRNGKASKVLVK